MTKSFTEWRNAQMRSQDVVAWTEVHALSDQAARFWLSAFVKEVERQASVCSDLDDHKRWGKAFEYLVRDFGLEVEDKPDNRYQCRLCGEIMGGSSVYGVGWHKKANGKQCGPVDLRV